MNLNTLRDIVTQNRAVRGPNGGPTEYTTEVKQAILAYKVSNNLSASAVSRGLIGSTLMQPLICRWEKVISPTEAIGFVHGKRVRFDVLTKCKLAKRVIEGHELTRNLATEQGVVPRTITKWVREFRSTYQKVLDSNLEGVPYIVKDEKMLYGNAAIAKKRRELDSLIDSRHAEIRDLRRQQEDLVALEKLAIKLDIVIK